MIHDDSLYLYNLTIQHPTPGTSTVLGQFTATSKKAQQLVVAHTTTLQIYTLDASTGKLVAYGRSHHAVFATITNIDKLRVPGSSKDLLVVTSDSGNLSILELNTVTKQFEPVVQQPVGKNGIGRLSHNSYLTIDPSNRALCVSALQRNKLVYRIKASASGNVELESPLEASSRETFTLFMAPLDVGLTNPVFGAIEAENSASELKLNYYELDQGLNHVVKKKKGAVPASASYLVPLPPHIGGVLVCCGGPESYLIHENDTSKTYTPLPVRSGTSETTIVAHVTHKLKKNAFFVLLQSTLGDLFKLIVDYDPHKEVVQDIQIKYFDTIAPTTSLAVFRSGFLYANTCNNDKNLYQFESVGDDTDDDSTLHSSHTADNLPDVSSRIFSVRPLENLALVDMVDDLCPLVDAQLVQTSHTKRSSLVTLSSCYLKTLTQGVMTSSVASSPLPMLPTNIFASKLTLASANDEYLVLTSHIESKTLVLSIGEVVEEVPDSNFIETQATIAVQQVGKASIVQVYSNGIRHIKNQKTSDWFPPAGIQIKHATTNNEQIVIGLSNAEIVYFEVDPMDDQLVEYQEKLELSSSITAITIGNSRSSFAVVACGDETIQVVSLHPRNCLEIVSLQALSSTGVSLAMMHLNSVCLVHIGMDNGVYVRTTIDQVTGTLSDTRIKYLGTKPVSVSLISGGASLLAISSDPWVGFESGETFKLAPLLNTSISKGTSFVSEDIGGEGIVGLNGSTLEIFTMGDEETTFDSTKNFNIDKLKLKYSPRKMVVDKDERIGNITVYVGESQYGVKSQTQEKNNNQESRNKESNEENEALEPLPAPNSWASCIQLISLGEENVITQTINLSSSDSICSMQKIRFGGSKVDHLVVGISFNQRYLPNSTEKNHLYTFKILKKKGLPNKLEFLHKTEVEFQPVALEKFKGKLLVGSSNYLRLYDLGQKQLLRKTSSKIDHVSAITRVLHQGNNRVVVCDARSSTVFVKYDDIENVFVPIVDDMVKRQVTALATIDYDTVVGGDKFGNLWVSRVPSDVSAKSDHDWTMVKSQEPYLNGSPYRSTNMCEFHLSDIPTSFVKGSLGGGQESIIYTGLQGTIGLLLPLATKSEVAFLVKLESVLRSYFDYNFDDLDTAKNGYNLLGKDHLKFRGYYCPVKNVIDGDLIEKFYELPYSAKIRLANQLDRTPKEVERKIYDLRNRSAL